MKQQFHTFTAAPRFTSSEPEQPNPPKYKAGDTIYLDVSGDKYILTVSSYNESENSVMSSSFKFKWQGDKNWKEDSDGFFFLGSSCGFERTIHPSLEGIEGLPPVETGDLVYLSLRGAKFLVVTDKTYDNYIGGNYFALGPNGKWVSHGHGTFVLRDYTRHANLEELIIAAKNCLPPPF